MKLHLYVMVKQVATYAACATEAERAHYISTSAYNFPNDEWLKVGEIECEAPPLDNSMKLVAAEAITGLQRQVRAKSEAECTELEGVKQSLLALTYEGEAV